jgi:L-ascorbate metabolism protein UlaG (beta-lactamase superfamily)
MEVQFYGANCLTINTKLARIVIDDNLVELGGKSATKVGDIAVFTHQHGAPKEVPKLIIDSPGEYEVSGVSIQGIAARSHMDEASGTSTTLYKILIDDVRLVVTGHIHPELSDKQLEAIGVVDVLCIPMGGNGYTLDPEGALQLIKEIEPKLVIPTHYADSSLNYPVPQKKLEEILPVIGMEPIGRVNKLKIKLADLTDLTQLIILEKS